MEDLRQSNGANPVVELTARIVAAYVSNNIVPIGDLSKLIVDVHQALDHLGSGGAAAAPVEPQKPAVPIKKSVQDDQITCLECGLKFKSLKRHLSANHGLDPDGYREKWELPADYPMVAPAYATARSRLAKTMGLGQKRK